MAAVERRGRLVRTGESRPGPAGRVRRGPATHARLRVVAAVGLAWATAGVLRLAEWWAARRERRATAR